MATREASEITSENGDVPVKASSPFWERAKGLSKKTFKTFSKKNLAQDLEQKKNVSVAMLGKLKMRAAEARQETKKKHSIWNRVIIEPDSTIRVLADLVSVLLLVYTIFEIPFTIIFLETEYCSWDWRVVVNLIADIVFMMEIFLNFNTAYYSEEAMILVREHRLIAARYMKGWFYIDICSSLPLEHIMCAVGAGASNSALLRAVKIMRFLKLARIAKFLRVLRKWEMQSGSRVFGTSVRIIKFVSLMVMSAHLCGCLWMLLIDMAQCQIPLDAGLPDSTSSCSCHGDNCQPLNWMVLYDEELAEDRSNDTSASKYLLSLYFTIMTLATVGYGDIAPTNDYERLYAVVLAMLGAMVFAFCIGSISNLATEGNRFEMVLESTQREVTDFMHFRGVPKDLQIRVRKHLNHTAKRAPHLVHPCLSLLPRSLRNEVIESVSRESVSGIKWFENMDGDFRSQLLALMRPLSLRPGESLFKALESATEMYIVVSGFLQVWDLDERLVVAKLGEGDVVGEIGLLEDALPYRTATVTARTECELLELQREDFHRHIKPLYPDAYQAIKELGQVRLKHLFLPDKLRAKFRAVSSTRTGTLREWKERFLKSRAAVATATAQHAIIGVTTASNRLPMQAHTRQSKRGRSVSAFEAAAISITNLHASKSPATKLSPRNIPGLTGEPLIIEEEEAADPLAIKPEEASSLRRRMSLPTNLRSPDALQLSAESPAVKSIRKWSIGRVHSVEEDEFSQGAGLKLKSNIQQIQRRSLGRNFAEDQEADPVKDLITRQFSETRVLQPRLQPPSDSVQVPLPGQPSRPSPMNRVDTGEQQRLNAQTGPNLNDLLPEDGSVGSIQSQASSGSMLNQKQSSPNPMSRQSTGLSSTIAEDDSVHSNGSGPASKRGNQSAPTPLEIRNPKPLANGTAGQGHAGDQPDLSHSNSLGNLKQSLLRPLPQHPPSRAHTIQPLPSGNGIVGERGWSKPRGGRSLSPKGRSKFGLSENGGTGSRTRSEIQLTPGKDKRGREKEKGEGGGGGERERESGGDVAAIGKLLEGMEKRIQAELRCARETHERQVGELQKQVALLRDEVAEIKGTKPHSNGT